MRNIWFLSAAALLAMTASPVMAESPKLPPGLGGDGSDAGSSSAPDLPAGLGGEEKRAEGPEKEKSWQEKLPFTLTGFAETRYGRRLQDDPHQRRTSISEARLHVEAQKMAGKGGVRLAADLIHDTLDPSPPLDLETGRGTMDLREAYFTLRPGNVDIRAGRQIITWGTGDMLFLNDLFPKDWKSYFTGRDSAYLKAPSDSVRVSAYGDLVNLDVVYTPRFDSARFIDGRRVSYNSGGTLYGRNRIMETVGPNDGWDDDEISVRLHRMIGAHEVALYAFDGYWKTPQGETPGGQAYHPELSTLGASVRGPLAGGIGNAEMAFYESGEDTDGDNGRVRNGEWRFLSGYERELVPDFTGSVQYYLEHMRHYDAYKRSLPAGTAQKDLNRHVFTLRLTRLLMRQDLELSFFGYYSPSDKDAYLRPNVSWKVDDRWTIFGGANLFSGNTRTTFFGQFEDATNVYAGVRYGF